MKPRKSSEVFKVPALVQKCFPSITWRFPEEEAVYLTFDDGPDPKITPWVLSALRDYQATATFFLVGDNVRKYPDVVKKVVEEGHSVGNHTFHHLNGWKVKWKEYQKNLEACSAEMNRLGIETKLFRPPYGKVHPYCINRIRDSHSIIMWDVLSKDYDKSFNSNFILGKLKKHTKAGSIVVFHDSSKAEKNLKSVLPGFLEFLSRNNVPLRSIPQT